MELRDGEVVLRPLVATDLETIVAACADPEIPRFTLLVPSPYTESDGRAFLEHVEQQWQEGRPERTFGITVHDELQGVVSVSLDDGVVGYWMRREGRGRGWTTSAVVLAVDWARGHGVERFYLTTHPDNLASQRVAEKAGFRRLGMIQEARGFRDGTTAAVAFELLVPQRR